MRINTLHRKAPPTYVRAVFGDKLCSENRNASHWSRNGHTLLGRKYVVLKQICIVVERKSMYIEMDLKFIAVI